jgi:uracil-DNA glycosylase
MNEKEFKQQLLNELYAPYKETSLQKAGACIVNSYGCTKIVFGEGNPDADLMFIGEAPGREEDELGRPFVGKSGKLLNKAFETVGIKREDVFITNLVKCRPPNNRVPSPQEIALFKPLLCDEIKVVRPHIICPLGASALNGLLNDTMQITKVHGKKLIIDGVTVIPLYHPAYILRNMTAYKDLLHDLKYIIHSLKNP